MPPWNSPSIPHGPALLSVDALLEKAVALGASDLHLTSGSLPAVRLHGHIELLADFPELDPDLVRQLVYRITTTEQQKHLELSRQLDFAYGIRGLARFRVNAYYQRESLAAAFRTIPTDDQVARGAEAPVLAARVHFEAARARARHRPDRLGQVDHARVADRRDQPHPHRPHHHDRGSDRVPARPQALHRQPARDRSGRHRLRRSPPRRAPPGPRRDPPRRDARPRDDRAPR